MNEYELGSLSSKVIDAMMTWATYRKSPNDTQEPWDIRHKCYLHMRIQEINIMATAKKQWTECLCPPKCVYWNHNPQGEDIRRWELWGWLCHESGALLNEISVLIREPSKLPSPFSNVKTWGEDGCLWTRTSSADTKLPATWSQTSSLELCEK